MINKYAAPAQFEYSRDKVPCYFNTDFSLLDKEHLYLADESFEDISLIVFITDENILKAHPKKFEGKSVIVVPAGEKNKNQQSVDKIISQLIAMECDRKVFIVGVGGGVITDMAGYVASVYMRGVRFALVPTSILCMVDAGLGGKNGVDVGSYKNLVGTITHPNILLYDFSFLTTLPEEEWVSGFAEIIKHACIKDSEMFNFLEQKTLSDFQQNPQLIAELVEQNVRLKYAVVSGDEKESGDRKLLNFGHTIGHAIEYNHGLLHGFAVSIGMVAACIISEKIAGFSSEESKRVKDLCQRYGLPVLLKIDKDQTWNMLLHDKKRTGDTMSFIVLSQIGKGVVQKLPLTELKELLYSLPVT